MLTFHFRKQRYSVRNLPKLIIMGSKYASKRKQFVKTRDAKFPEKKQENKTFSYEPKRKNTKAAKGGYSSDK